MNVEALKLSVYFGESVTSGAELASDSIMRCFADRGFIASVLFRGIEGFGINRRIHAARFPDVSTDLPLLAVAVDAPARIEAALDDVDRAVPRGLLTFEHARLATGNDVAHAEFPEGPGRAAKLTIYCRSGERVGGRLAYREVVNVLRRFGAAGAIVLGGVDGTLSGARGRTRLFSSNADAPAIVISVGPTEVLRRSLPHLQDCLKQPIVTLEAIAQLKHDGELLEAPPTPASVRSQAPDVWQTLRVYTRQSAMVNGRSLYSELTRRLREVGAAGATTILGEWGFSSDEVPHGDKFGTFSSHRPSYTVYIDHPEKIAEVWPIVDEITAEHGVVTSLLVPGYRERAGKTVRGFLSIKDVSAIAQIGKASGPADSNIQGVSLPDIARELPPDVQQLDWVEAFVARLRAFVRSRGAERGVIRVTLADGEQFFLFSLESGPGAEFITLYPHPERYDEMLKGNDGRPVPPRAVIVPYRSIAKIELLTRAPRGTRSLMALQLPD
jgi:PII-like signaling protein